MPNGSQGSFASVLRNAAIFDGTRLRFFREPDLRRAFCATLLYARWSGKPFPLDGLPVQPMQAYEPLLSLWETEDLEALETALLAACDFHMERSKLSQAEIYEFTTAEDVLYPVEILALLRLREARGLINPDIDHPLSDSTADCTRLNLYRMTR